MADFMEYEAYYKKAWEKNLSEKNNEHKLKISELQTKADRYRKALEEIERFSSFQSPVWRIAHEALED